VRTEAEAQATLRQVRRGEVDGILKTAKDLGLTIAPEVLFQADRLIR
jgi:hypothetical protein